MKKHYNSPELGVWQKVEDPLCSSIDKDTIGDIYDFSI